MRIIIPVLLFLPLAACDLGVAPVDAPRDPTALNIRFIGNRLTTTNDLPGILLSMIDSANAGPAEIATVAFPNFGLEDHWATGDAQRTRSGVTIGLGAETSAVLQTAAAEANRQLALQTQHPK